MKILLERTELALLLEQKKEYIGTTKDGIWDSLFASGTFLFSLLYTECQDIYFISGEAIKFFYLCITIIFLGRGIIKMMKGNEYSVDKLYSEISNLNRVEHPFSIIGIRDTYNEYANRYLLYYDNRWKSFLFPNGRTAEDIEKNESQMLEMISNTLKIPAESLIIEKAGEQIHQKYSVSDEEMKWYHHTFYRMKVLNFPKNLREKEFVIDGTVFRWMSISEMEADTRIQEVNSDIVTMVKGLYL